MGLVYGFVTKKISKFLRYSYEYHEHVDKFEFVAHYDEIWIKQDMDAKSSWRKIKIVKIIIDFRILIEFSIFVQKKKKQ